MATRNIEESENSAHSKTVERAGAVMAILLLIFFLGTSDSQMISPLLPIIARDFGLDVGEVGRLMGPAYALAAATSAFLIGPLSDRYGRRQFLLYASILFSISLLATYLIEDARALAAIRVLTGFAAGAFSTCSIAYVGDYFPYSRRGLAMSVVQAGYFVALVLGVPVANILAQRQGWRASFMFFGALSGVAFILVAMILPDDRAALAEHNSVAPGNRLTSIKTSFSSVERIAAIIAAFFVSAGFVGFLFYLGSWLKKDLGLGTGEVNIFFIAVGFAALAGGIVAAPVADRVGKRGLSILSTLLLAAMLILIPRLAWGAFLFAGFLTASLAFAFRQGPLQALATELVPRNARGSFVAVRNTASQMGIAVSTSVSGLLYDNLGYSAVGLFGFAATMAAAACIFLMREPQTETASAAN